MHWSPDRSGPEVLDALPLCLNQERRLAREEIAARASRRLAPSNLVSAVRLTGPLDPLALSTALQTIVNRHSALRSSITARRGMPPTIRAHQLQVFAETGVCDPGLFEQTILSSPELPLPTLVLEGRSPVEVDDIVTTLFDEEASAPFDYAHPPLLRARLLRTSALEHTLLLTASHLVFDSPSIPLLWRELLALYERRVGADDTDLPAPATQYHDFAIWQSGPVGRSELRDASAFWKNRWSELGSAQLSCLDLRWSRDADGKAETGSEVEVVETDAKLAARIHQGCAARGVTPYSLFFAAFALFLHRSTGRERVTPWIVCPNRQRAGTEAMLGWLSNLHMIAVDVSPTLPIAALVDRCRAAVRDTLAHQELPLAMLWCELGQNLVTPAPGIIFDWQVDAPLPSPANLGVQRVRPANRWSPVSLGLCFRTVQHGAGFRTTVIYSSDYFDRPRVRRAAHEFNRALEQTADAMAP